MAQDSPEKVSAALAEAKAYMREGKRAEAVQVLRLLNHPKRDEWIAKAEGRAYVPAPEKVKKPDWFLYFCAALIGIPLLVVTVYGIYTFRQNDFYVRIESACREFFRESWIESDRFTFNQVYEGCRRSAQNIVRVYNEEVHYCYNHENQTEARFLACLDENDAGFAASYIIDAPERIGDPTNVPIPNNSLPTVARYTFETPTP